jgi:hypothetical protein
MVTLLAYTSYFHNPFDLFETDLALIIMLEILLFVIDLLQGLSTPLNNVHHNK